MQVEQDREACTETFELNNLEKFFVNQEWLEQQLNDNEINSEGLDGDYLKRLRAEGRWPPGPLGDKLFSDMGSDLASFVTKVRNLNVGEKLEDSLVDYKIGEGKHCYHLLGKLHHCHQNGNLLYRYARCKPRDQMAAWLNHLIVLNNGGTNTTYLMQMDEFVKFTAPENAQALLIDMLDLYREAQTSLSQLILPAAFSWAEFSEKASTRSKKTPQQVALEAFNKEASYDSYWQLLYRNGDIESLFESDDFQSSMSSIVVPLIKNKQAIIY